MHCNSCASTETSDIIIPVHCWSISWRCQYQLRRFGDGECPECLAITCIRDRNAVITFSKTCARLSDGVTTGSTTRPEEVEWCGTTCDRSNCCCTIAAVIATHICCRKLKSE